MRKILNNQLPLNLSTTSHAVLFLHRIAESVSPPNLYTLAYIVTNRAMILNLNICIYLNFWILTIFIVLWWKLKNCIQILCIKAKLFRKWDLKVDHWLLNRCFLDFSIVIDSDKRTSLRAFKKNKLPWKLSPWHVFKCLGMRWILSSQIWPKKWCFRLFTPNLPQLGLLKPYFVCESSLRIISMIKIVILDQSKPISLILKNNKSKIQKSIVNWTFIIYKNRN